MKKEKMLKLMLIIVMAVVLFAMSTEVFALSSEDLFSGNQAGSGNTTGNDVYIDISNTVEQPSAPSTSTPSTSTPSTNTPSANTNGNNYNTNIPHAGATGNTLVGVVATVLVITAIYAYKKVNDYKNI